MKLAKITAEYYVSPQLDASDLEELAKLGFKTVICNRPDSEHEPDQHSAKIEAESAKRGLDFISLPVNPSQISEDDIQRQGQALSGAKTPVVAYCKTGARCALLWCLSEVKGQGVEKPLLACASAGHDFSNLWPKIEAYGSSGVF